MVPLGAGLGAGDDEEPVRELGVGRPDLLAVDDPLVAVAGAPWSARWRGRSRRRARSSPGTTAPRRPGSSGRKRSFCSSVPNAISVGPSSSSPRWLTRAGRVGPGVLLVEDHLLPQLRPRPPCSSASRRRSSRARRGAGSRPAAPRTPRARGPGRRAPARPANSPVRCSSSQSRISARKPRPRRSRSGPRLVLYQANVWLVERTRATRSLAPARGRGAVRRPPGRTSRATRIAVLRRPARPRSQATAAAYAELGLGPGDRVVLWAPNSIDWAVAALAVSYAGGVLVPANSRYTGHEVADIVERTGAHAGRGRTTASSAATQVAELRADAGVVGSQVVDARGESLVARTDAPPSVEAAPTRSPPTTSPTSCSPPAPPAAPRAR